jgi:sulfur carrier protein ThiS
MEVEVKLFGNLGHYLPEGGNRFSFTKQFNEKTTVEHLLKELALPEAMPVLVVVNGRRVEKDYVLHDKDDVVLFSPAEGG